MDLLVNLYDLQCKHDAKKLADAGVVIRRALSPDKGRIMDFIKTHYDEGWMFESEHALMNTPISCYIALKGREIVGFSCYDATAKGYLGPIGIRPGEKGGGIGQSLMYETLLGMKEAGYGYAVIGWVDEAVGFYEKTIKMFKIPNSDPANTVYQNLSILADEKRMELPDEKSCGKD